LARPLDGTANQKPRQRINKNFPEGSSKQIKELSGRKVLQEDGQELRNGQNVTELEGLRSPDKGLQHPGAILGPVGASVSVMTPRHSASTFSLFVTKS
jgi:hypothetical protein